MQRDEPAPLKICHSTHTNLRSPVPPKPADSRCFFYITNDWDKPPAEIVFEANHRCDQENLIQQHKGDVRSPAEPVDTLVSFYMHFIPTGSSWRNVIERWFRNLTQKRLRRGEFRSVAEDIPQKVTRTKAALDKTPSA